MGYRLGWSQVHDEPGMSETRDQVVIATYSVDVLDDGTRLVRPETLTDDEFQQFFQFLKRFPQRFEWSDALEGWICKE